MIRLLAMLLGFSCFFSCQETPYVQGKRVYEAMCSNCHMSNGSGLAALIPPLAESDYLTQHQEELPCIIRHGLKDTIQVNGQIYSQEMQGVELDDVALHNVINYINNSFGNNNGETRLDITKERLKRCAAD